MNCTNHSERTAVAVCVNCGAALCADCCKKTDTRKNVCSSECAAYSMAIDDAVLMTAARSIRARKVLAWFCWLISVIFGVFGAASLLGEDKFFAFYLLASCALFVFIGSWYYRIGTKASNRPLQPTPASGRG